MVGSVSSATVSSSAEGVEAELSFEKITLDINTEDWTEKDGAYEITEKGRQDGELTADSIAYTVKQRAENAVARFNRQLRRSSFVKTQIVERPSGEFSVILSLDDEVSNLMTLELFAPDQRQAVRLSKLFEKKAETVYTLIMTELLEGEDEIPE